MREIISFECTVCKNRNYSATKNKKKHPDRMETSKFCRTCRKHTPHKEIK
jgi:large subunit ribosomal protein L33